MIHIRFERLPNTLIYSSDYFDVNYEREWFRDPLVQQIVQDIDHSMVISDSVIDSPVLDLIGPRDLSNGAKTLILMLKEPEHEFNGTAIGDNCGAWMIRIGKMHDITVVFRCIFHFHPLEERWVADINAVCDFNGMKIDSMVDYMMAYNDYVLKTE